VPSLDYLNNRIIWTSENFELSGIYIFSKGLFEFIKMYKLNSEYFQISLAISSEY
jgi:hypothetical protein